MLKVKVNWDCDGENPSEYNLPSIVEVPQMEEENIADWLSDNYGWCVLSFDYVK